MTLVTDATFSLSSRSMPSSITWSAQRMRLARLWYTRLWQEDSAELSGKTRWLIERERERGVQGRERGCKTLLLSYAYNGVLMFILLYFIVTFISILYFSSIYALYSVFFPPPHLSLKSSFVFLNAFKKFELLIT